MKADVQFDKEVLPVAKVGLTLPLDAGMFGKETKVKWVGRGPLENYVDRFASSFLGEYELPLSELNYSYLRPQEAGNRGEVKFIEI